MYLFFFFFNDTATTAIYTLSLHDALPISRLSLRHDDADQLFFWVDPEPGARSATPGELAGRAGHRVDTAVLPEDRKSTRLNSSHPSISYAVFCLKKKKNNVEHRANPFTKP